MKAQVAYSGNMQRRGYGRMPYVVIELTPENEAEKAILRMAYSGSRTMDIWESGTAAIQIRMPRGKNS